MAVLFAVVVVVSKVSVSQGNVSVPTTGDSSTAGAVLSEKGNNLLQGRAGNAGRDHDFLHPVQHLLVGFFGRQGSQVILLAGLFPLLVDRESPVALVVLEGHVLVADRTEEAGRLEVLVGRPQLLTVHFALDMLLDALQPGLFVGMGHFEDDSVADRAADEAVVVVDCQVAKSVVLLQVQTIVELQGNLLLRGVQ